MNTCLQNLIMALSVLQLTKQRTKDRSAVTKRLETNLNLLSISISYDGGIKFSGEFTCGIFAQDSTQHKMFVLEVDLEEECPFDPCRLGMPEICNMAREYMRGQGIEMLATKYEAYLVSHIQKDLAGEANIRPKYRAVVNRADNNSYFTPGQSLEQPEVFRRMPHIFFGKIVEMKAAMENKGGSSEATNMNKVQKAASVMKRFLTVQYTNPSSTMPSYTSNLAFTSVESVKAFVDFIEKKTIKHDEIMKFVAGIFPFELNLFHPTLCQSSPPN